MSAKIYAPNVHLFAFHLKDSNQPNLLWDKCNQLLSEKLHVTKKLEIEEHEGYQVDLLKDKTGDGVSLQFESTVECNSTQLPITGFATPLRIHDSYVLTLNLRRPEFDENQKKTNPVELSFLKLINPSGSLMPSQIAGSLGQTILLTVWYTQDKQWLPWKSPQNRQQLRELANNCLRQFIPNNYPCPDFNKEGQLFDSPIFEYGIPTQDKDYCHVLVWIYCESETSEKFVNSYNDFFNLFHFRNKIIAAYHHSRKVYQVIKHDYQEIETYLDNIFQNMHVYKTLNETEFNQFKRYLKEIHQKYVLYSQLIRELDHHRLTIEINAQNYKREIRDIQSQLPTEDISFLSSFVDEYCHLFSEQIQADLGYFQHGATLLEKAMTAIQGRVEIEQAESDRRLQQTLRENEVQAKERDCQLQQILKDNEAKAKERDRDLQKQVAFLSFGLVATSMGASNSRYLIAPNPGQSPTRQPFNLHAWGDFVLSFGVGIVCGGIFALLWWVRISLLQSYTQHKDEAKSTSTENVLHQEPNRKGNKV